MKPNIRRLLAVLLVSILATVGFTSVASPAFAANCGDVRATVNGVDVKSNGIYEANGESCGGSTQNTATTPSGATVTTGYRWQCVEFVNRYYVQKGWITARWPGNGQTLKDNLPSGLTYQANGSITSIVVGDVVTLSKGDYGHAGVVSGVVGTTVTIANQNGGNGLWGTATYNSAVQTLTSEYSGYTMQGVVHATANSSSGGGGSSLDDIYAINRADTGSGHTAMHIINGANWGLYEQNTATGLPYTDANWDYEVGDLNGDGVLDLWGINRNPGGTHTVVHVLNGVNLGSWLQAGDIVLPGTDANWDFELGDYNGDGKPDIYAINRNTGGTGTVVHVVNGANWGQYLQNGGIVLPATDSNWSFAVGKYNSDSRPDIYAVNRVDTGSGHTAVHVIDGSNWGLYLLNTATGLPYTDVNWDFAFGKYDGDAVPDLYAINRNPGGGNTVVHVLNGANLSSWFQAGNIVLPATDSNWSFAVGNH